MRDEFRFIVRVSESQNWRARTWRRKNLCFQHKYRSNESVKEISNQKCFKSLWSSLIQKLTQRNYLLEPRFKLKAKWLLLNYLCKHYNLNLFNHNNKVLFAQTKEWVGKRENSKTFCSYFMHEEKYYSKRLSVLETSLLLFYFTSHFSRVLKPWKEARNGFKGKEKF